MNFLITIVLALTNTAWAKSTSIPGFQDATFKCFDESTKQPMSGLLPKSNFTAICDVNWRRLIEIKDGKCVFIRDANKRCKDMTIFPDEFPDDCPDCYPKNRDFRPPIEAHG